MLILCLKMASAGFSIISYLARGIDTLPHKAALSSEQIQLLYLVVV
jgi:predicted Rossmann fold nucleotide-binding protein DprA/Smf involved in DNA uptake